MTEGFVADASVGVAWSVQAQSSRKTDGLLDEIAEGRPLWVPALWLLEVANALLVLTRRKRITPRDFAVARRALAGLRPTVDDEGSRFAMSELSDLAAEQTLSVYDAVYLELAARRGLPLASRDAALNKAAQRCGVRVLL